MKCFNLSTSFYKKKKLRDDGLYFFFTMTSCTITSAPGKVLVTGGYLVLEQAFWGCVVSTSSRFYTIIQAQSKPNHISVHSPQFEQADWTYVVTDDFKLKAV